MIDRTAATRLQIGDLVLDKGIRQVSRSGVPIDLPKLSYRLFNALVNAAPNVVSHDDLADFVWDGRAISPATLSQRVALVRNALGDDANHPKYIRLQRGQGYHLLQKVEPIDSGDVSSRHSTPSASDAKRNGPARRQRQIRWMSAAIVGAIAIVTAPILIFDLFGKNNAESQRVGEAGPLPPTVAVLPLRNRSTDETDNQFVDSIHDDLLTTLAQVDSLRVISRLSVEKYRGTNMTIREIGEELGVDAILEGGAQRAGNQIRVNVQLVDVETNLHLWARSFDEQMSIENMLSIQSTIAQAVANATRTELSQSIKARLNTPQTTSYPAYVSYHSGVDLLRRRTGATIEGAIEHFKDAIRLDSDFSEAHARLADSYLLLPGYASESPERSLVLALQSARRSINLAPNDGEGIASLAMVYFEAARQNIASIERIDPQPLFEKAIALSPSYVTGYQWYGEFLHHQGRVDDAHAQYQTAMSIDPFSPILNHVYAQALADIGMYSLAEKHFRRAIDIEPGLARAYQGLAALYFADLGRFTDAARMAHRAILLNPTNSTNYALLSNIYLHLGDLEEAERLLNESIRLSPENRSALFVSILLNLRKGQLTAAFSAAEASIESGLKDSLVLGLVSNHYLKLGDTTSALDVFRRTYPVNAVFGPTEITNLDRMYHADYAHALLAAGHRDDANMALERASILIAEGRNANGYRNFVRQAEIAVLRGEFESAIQSLQRAFDAGWRRHAFYTLERDPKFDSVRDLLAFQKISRAVSEDMTLRLSELRGAR